MQEKRTVRRYRLSLPAIFSWVDGEKHTCGGFTRDVSTKGAFVFCSEPVPGDAVVEIEILLPASGEVPRLICTGRYNFQGTDCTETYNFQAIDWFT